MRNNRPISEHFASGAPVVSLEFFPPKNPEGGEQILKAASRLKEAVDPDFVSITYGAGGSTRDNTRKYANILKESYAFEVMPHLTCVGSSCAEIEEIVRDYAERGFRNIMALRGDPPKGDTTFRPHPDGPQFAADLVRLIRRVFPDICIGVAGYPESHPESPSPEKDIEYLKRKVDEGASFITTQMFYDNADFFSFVERCHKAGITLPIIPGIMPVFTSLDKIRRFCKKIPAQLEQNLEAVGDDTAAIRQVGADWAYQQIHELLRGGVAPGFHLYIMNRSKVAAQLMERLKVDGLVGANGTAEAPAS